MRSAWVCLNHCIKPMFTHELTLPLVIDAPPSLLKTPPSPPWPAEPDSVAPSATLTPITVQVVATVPAPILVDSRLKQDPWFRKTQCDGTKSNRVRGKDATLDHMLGSLEPDIVIMVELDSIIKDSKLLTLRKRQDGNGGGVLIAVKEALLWNSDLTWNAKYTGLKCISKPWRPYGLVLPTGPQRVIQPAY